MLYKTQSIASLLPLIPFNTKAPYLHTVSVFYHRELNSLREVAKLLYIQPFLAFSIVQRAKLSYKYISCCTSGNTDSDLVKVRLRHKLVKVRVSVRVRVRLCE